jgi:hypothetical protein
VDVAAQTEYFEKKVRPVLVSRCQPCHNSKIKTAGLDLETGAGFTSGGPSGALISKDKWEESRLLHVVGYEERIKMPPTGKLKPDELAAITEWVKNGGIWPGASIAVSSSPAATTGSGTRRHGAGITPLEREFWAFQAVRDPEVPKVKNTRWVKNPIDRFLLAKLEVKGLKPAAPASKEALLRRASYDVTGLPPTEKELDAFLADSSANAFEKVVDRLLGSPRYGEQWARHWLDIARYADSTGNDEDHRYPYAWRYRDYVIDAFNRDLPYDQFVREQVAGDLMPSPDGGAVNVRGVVATGFLALGPKALAQPDKRKMIVDVWDEQIDVTSRAFLGLTVACARCHDHKFDPIQTRDYYSLMGMFASTTNFEDQKSGVAKLLYVPLVEKKVYQEYEASQARIDRKRIAREMLEEDQLLERDRKLGPRIAEYMLAAAKLGAQKLAVSDAAKQAVLDEVVLEKWVKFLEPKGAPPYLDAWFQTKPEDLTAGAAAYQKKYLDALEDWSKQMSKWRANAEKYLSSDSAGKPPVQPSSDAVSEKAPFFHAVSLDEGPYAVAAKDFAKAYGPEFASKIEGLKKEESELKKALPPEPAMACAVEDGPVVDQKVFVRGDYASEGEAAPKVFPQVMQRPDDPVVAQGSGRLELAAWLASGRNPMTARVMVNRLWLEYFGEGIVRTPDNFGKMGERPTHPELLDWLAVRFVEGGWSVKKMQKLMMMSAAYQMSSAASNEAVAADPENRLLAHFNRRRLSVEEIRDAMLAIDGSIDLEMGGTLQKGFGTDGENSNGRLSLNPEKVKRRMVYLPLRRSNLPSILNLFDFGDAVTPMGKRVLTNVAPQALFAMNSGFVQERSDTITKQLLKAYPGDERARLTEAYRMILSRAPGADEVDTLLTYVARFRAKFPARSEEVAWQSVSHILLASSEFFFLD